VRDAVDALQWCARDHSGACSLFDGAAVEQYLHLRNTVNDSLFQTILVSASARGRLQGFGPCGRRASSQRMDG
jgi:hypothetical protein